MALTTPKVDKNADAEAIFWEAWVEDSIQGSYGNHRVTNYVRIKLYNERALEKHGNVELKYFTEAKMSVYEIKGRTIQPDGTIIELKKDAIFDSVKAKIGKRKYKARTFAMPGMKPGAVIEYQWIENTSETVPTYVRLDMQLELPAWEVNYFVKPLTSEYFPYAMRAYPFQCRPSNWAPAGKGFQKTSITNVPAFVDEPRTPSDDNLKAWMLLYYTEDTKEQPEKFWKSQGKKYHELLKQNMKVNDDVKKLAAQLVAGKDAPLDKLNALAEFCRTGIKNVSYNINGMTAELREAYYKKPNEHAGDTLKTKMGDLGDINFLFASLAQAAGFEPHLVRASTANRAFMRPDMLNSYLLSNQLIAVTVSGQDHFFNPGVPFVPAGMVDWDEEGQQGVMSDGKEPKMVTLPFSVPSNNLRKRIANLQLQDDGSIRGDIHEEYTGQFSVSRKRIYESQSVSERESDIKEALQRRYGGAEITNLRLENADSIAGNVKIHYDLQMQGYAERTGKRLFFAANFFTRSSKPEFTATDRKYPINFGYAYTELDSVTIKIPPGFALDAAEQPGTTKLGQVGEYSFQIGVRKTNGVVDGIVTQRTLTFGEKGQVMFDVAAYPQLKYIFEKVSEMDGHTLTLKQQ